MRTLKVGKHLRDVANDLKCIKRTLQRHLKHKIIWKKPPTKEKNYTSDVSMKRLKFARSLLKRNGTIEKKIRKCYFP